MKADGLYDMWADYWLSAPHSIECARDWLMLGECFHDSDGNRLDPDDLLREDT
jgi:hypothetical protein